MKTLIAAASLLLAMHAAPVSATATVSLRDWFVPLFGYYAILSEEYPMNNRNRHDLMSRLSLYAATTGLALVASQAVGEPIQITGINMFRDFRAINDVGIASGDRLQYGANVVGGSVNTSLGATYKNLAGTVVFTDASANCSPILVNPNFCSNSTPFNSNRIARPWEFTFTRSGETPLVVQGPSLAGTNFRAPQPTNVTISGSGLTPTISWTLPDGYTPDGFRIQIFDKDRIRSGASTLADIVHNDNLPVTATSYTLPSVLETGGPLRFGGNYSINFQVIETRGDVTFTGAQTQILTRSSSFFAFTPLDNSAPPNVALPEVGIDLDLNDNLGAPYQFSIDNVGPASVTFIDPFVAVGYDYAIGLGDPNFASVILPNVGDGMFELLFGGQSEFVQAGDQFFFPGAGVAEFGVRGIETTAMLDPNNVAAFITGLTFATAGAFTGTMTPITVFIPDATVPAPGTLALIAFGLIGLRRRWATY